MRKLLQHFFDFRTAASLYGNKTLFEGPLSALQIIPNEYLASFHDPPVLDHVINQDKGNENHPDIHLGCGRYFPGKQGGKSFLMLQDEIPFFVDGDYRLLLSCWKAGLFHVSEVRTLPAFDHRIGGSSA